MDIIAITGYAGHGKDTVGSMLKAYGYTHIAFADPLRAMFLGLLECAGVDLKYMHDVAHKNDLIESLGISYREGMQTLGTEWGRVQHGEDFWIKVLQARMTAINATTGKNKFVITDLRFTDEADALRRQNARIWRVHNSRVPPVRAHRSEQELENIRYDAFLPNEGSLDDLKQLVSLTLQGLNNAPIAAKH